MPKTEGDNRTVPDEVTGNIDMIVRLEEEALARRTVVERLSDGVARFVGTFVFAAIHLALIGGWIAFNVVWPKLRLDPFPFGLLNLIVATEAVLLTTFVLSKQNRMSLRAERRSHLDLQVNMLTEKEVTKALQLLARISERLGMDAHETDEELRNFGVMTAVEDLARDLHEKLPTDP